MAKNDTKPADDVKPATVEDHPSFVEATDLASKFNVLMDELGVSRELLIAKNALSDAMQWIRLHIEQSI